MTHHDVPGRPLGDTVIRLRRTASPIEPLFLEVGEQLNSAVNLLGGTSQTFMSLNDRLGGDDLRRSIEGLERAAAGIAALGEGNSGNLAELERMAALINEIGARLSRLAKTIGEVQLLSINARIEAAQIATSGLDFSVFTREIGRLAALAEDGLARLGDELAALGALIRDTRDGQRRFEQAHHESLADITERIDGSVSSAGSHRDEATGAVVAVGEEVRRIGDRLGTAVLALQIGDITRQRVEHVCHALDLLEEVLRDGDGPATPPPPAEERTMMIAIACRLQAAQLTQAAGDLDDRSRGALDSLKALAEESRRIAAIGTHAFAGDDGSFLLDLSRHMQTADRLMRGYSGARAEMETLVRSVSDRVAEMVGHVAAVHSIEVDLRIMGLNATLKCARLGVDGRALSVVAQTLRGYAASTVADAAALMAGLDDIVTAAAALGSHADRGGGTAALSDLLGTMEGSAEILETAGRDLAGALAGLTGTSGQVCAILEASVARMDELAAIAGTLRQSAAELDEVAGDIDLGAPDIRRIQDRLLALFDNRYTMSSERDIHMLFAGEPPAAAPGNGEAGIDDLLF